MKIEFEKPVLIAFLLLFLWLGLGTLWSHTLSHDFPYGYSASDAYQHQVRAEWVKENGYSHEAPHIVMGYEDVIGYYMPGPSHLAALLSHASGLETYDTIYFMAFFASALSALVMYFALKSFDKNIAILALPFMLLAVMNSFYGAMLLGQWPFLFGNLFLVGAFWAIAKVEWKKSYLLIAAFITAIAMNHASELIFVAGFLGIVFGLQILEKKFENARKIAIAGAISIAAFVEKSPNSSLRGFSSMIGGMVSIDNKPLPLQSITAFFMIFIIGSLI